jgi:Raf kinase inhibitor-like YbhB/YbcL family protein
MRITSTAFDYGGEIPRRHTCDGEDVSPPLTLADVPAEAVTLALIVDDPDAPRGTFVHWLLWNIPLETGDLPEGVPAASAVPSLGRAVQGTNDFGRIGYRGPCPPDRRHTYRFLLYALSRELDLESGARRSALEGAMKGVIIAQAELTATYERQ